MASAPIVPPPPPPTAAPAAHRGLRAPHVEELLSVPDPLVAFERLRGWPYPLFLDSAADPERLGRYSFLTADPGTVVLSKGGHTTVGTPDGAVTRVTADDPLVTARALLAPFAADPVPGLPPFQGGLAGYIGYDYGSTLERLPAPRYDDLQILDVVLGLYDWVLAWDHQVGRAWLIATGYPEQDTAARDAVARRRCGVVRDRLAREREGDGGRGPGVPSSTAAPAPWWRLAPDGAAPADRARDAGADTPPTFPVPSHAGLRSSFSHQGYLAAVARVREYIVAGDIFQANLSQRFQAPYTGDPWPLYRRLRTLNPAPFAAYFEPRDAAVVSASPERFIHIDVDGAVETRPIKGTTPRGIGPEHDAHLGRALTESEKDRAENLMIVDLLRNDLSRVCAPGSVRVPELFALERFSTVHHLVSTVTGQLTPGRDPIDVFRAAFPGGSITGAPKVRAMEIIAELEPSRRGVYCGTLMYLSATGAADSSIVIRTYLAHHGQVYFSAGGGIVADSDPEAEYRETLDKARALIAALPLPTP